MFQNVFRRFGQRLLAPVDIASLAAFRILFGLLLLWHIAGIWEGVPSWYVIPRFHFKYFGFEWVEPWPEPGMSIHVAVLGVCALLLFLGLFYRLAAGLLCVGYVYVFLLEKTFYLNHEYLISLLCFLMIFLPAHRAASLDALRRPHLRTREAPAWTLWLLRFQIGIPYFYGGLAKLDGDWLSGVPVRMGLGERADFPLIGPFLSEEGVASLIVYGGLVFDLAVVPLLLWRRTRTLAFAVAVLFHITNAVLFDIGVFPWLMIAGTLLFFEPDWPRRFGRRLLGARLPPRKTEESTASPPAGWTGRQRLAAVLLSGYVGFQLLFPLRHLLYPGRAGWTEDGHRFAWRMMLVHKRGLVRFEAVDPETGERFPAVPGNLLTPWQHRRVAHDPDTILQLAHHLGRRLEQATGKSFEIRARAMVSLNGRKPQLLIDPDVDLMTKKRTILPKSWVLPLTEPLRDSPWDRPMREWLFYSADVAGEQAELPPQRRR